jgi:YgiT-type zinc finger domain-containing protein
MHCENCGSERARIVRVSRTFGKDADLLVIEGIPTVSCPDCAESYMTAATLHTIDSLRAQGDRLAEPRTVRVMRFDAA